MHNSPCFGICNGAVRSSLWPPKRIQRQRGPHRAQPEIDREPHADRAAAHDDDLTSLPQKVLPTSIAARSSLPRSNRRSGACTQPSAKRVCRHAQRG